MARDIWLAIIGIIYEDWEDFTYVGELPVDPPLALFDRIVYLIDHNIFCNLTRAKDGTENKLLRTVYRTHDTGVIRESNFQEYSAGSRNPLANIFRRKKKVYRPAPEDEGRIYKD